MDTTDSYHDFFEEYRAHLMSLSDEELSAEFINKVGGDPAAGPAAAEQRRGWMISSIIEAISKAINPRNF